MARSRILAAIALSIAAAVAGCAQAPARPAAAVTAPVPKEYTCDQQRRLAAEMRAWPVDSMGRQAMNDYGEIRDELRAAHNMPDPPKCPPAPPVTIVRVK